MVDAAIQKLKDVKIELENITKVGRTSCEPRRSSLSAACSAFTLASKLSSTLRRMSSKAVCLCQRTRRSMRSQAARCHRRARRPSAPTWCVPASYSPQDHDPLQRVPVLLLSVQHTACQSMEQGCRPQHLGLQTRLFADSKDLGPFIAESSVTALDVAHCVSAYGARTEAAAP